MFVCIPAGAVEQSERQRQNSCRQCGMNLEAYGKSRMTVEFADGTMTEVCSLSCAVAEMQLNRDRQVRSLAVADYDSLQLIDAKTARWVVGGNRSGGMNSPPKWAFAREEAANKFIEENGGELASFEEIMKTAASTKNHAHRGHDMSQHMGPGAQMIFNPGFGDDIYHTHPAGMWMVTYKFMHMDMSDLGSGTSDVGLDSIGFKRGKPYDYMMIPTSMTMDMHMLMLMYGITDRITVMGMANYLENSMDMLMDMGPGKMITTESPMRTRGLGDTELRGIMKINRYVNASLGLNLPTGDIDQTVEMMHQTYRAPYGMQLGSGTFDLKPALTYSALSADAAWNWGGQALYICHVGQNTNGYSLGDSIKVTGWLQRAFGPCTSWLRFAFSDTGHIQGRDPEIDKLIHPLSGMGAPTPDADPANYGGQRLDGLFGVAFQEGAVSIGVEGGIPIYQYLNGLQMKTKWSINTAIQVMF